MHVQQITAKEILIGDSFYLAGNQCRCESIFVYADGTISIQSRHIHKQNLEGLPPTFISVVVGPDYPMMIKNRQIF